MYYDQLHINVKSYNQWKLFLNKLNFNTHVIYAENNNHSFRHVVGGHLLITAKSKAQ